MNLDENISNAFKVVRQTYANVDKLIGYLISEAGKYGYISCIPNFLRWRSDNNNGGWLINDFIMLFQRESDKLLQNDWRAGSVYSLEICFEEDLPFIYISRNDYENIESWSSGCSKSEHWGFYWQRRKKDFNITEKDNYYISVPKTDKIKNSYWGFKKSAFIKDTFTDITSQNVKMKIFDVFDKLSELDI